MKFFQTGEWDNMWLILKFNREEEVHLLTIEKSYLKEITEHKSAQGWIKLFGSKIKSSPGS